jgi:hypothetical protein
MYIFSSLENMLSKRAVKVLEGEEEGELLPPLVLLLHGLASYYDRPILICSFHASIAAIRMPHEKLASML